jgi:hypothetical protein
MVRFLFLVLLPLAALGVLGYTVAGAIQLLREDAHPEKSFLELMQLSFTRLPLADRIKPDTPIPSIRGE